MKSYSPYFSFSYDLCKSFVSVIQMIIFFKWSTGVLQQPHQQQHLSHVIAHETIKRHRETRVSNGPHVELFLLFYCNIRWQYFPDASNGKINKINKYGNCSVVNDCVNYIFSSTIPWDLFWSVTDYCRDMGEARTINISPMIWENVQWEFSANKKFKSLWYSSGPRILILSLQQ